MTATTRICRFCSFFLQQQPNGRGIRRGGVIGTVSIGLTALLLFLLLLLLLLLLSLSISAWRLLLLLSLWLQGQEQSRLLLLLSLRSIVDISSRRRRTGTALLVLLLLCLLPTGTLSELLLFVRNSSRGQRQDIRGGNRRLRDCGNGR